MKEIYVWDTMRTYYTNGEEGSSLVIDGKNIDLIKNSPSEIKIIIAFYLKYIPYYIEKEEEIKLAKALGNFTSLHEAKQNLLYTKEHYFEKIKRNENYWVEYLIITVEENKVLVKLANIEIDEYIVKKDNSIQFIKTVKL